VHRQIQSLTSDFANLKMLGHVFIVEDAKDLAQIVRDVTRYGGAYRPEVSRSQCISLATYASRSLTNHTRIRPPLGQDVYEFIQRRSDWKKIEKVVDKTMYNLNLREDCIVA
jgi:recyclin-1